ncbi:flagellar motor protein MotB [Gallaecimonas kandeliae]|uniref:flagellar motor protein MotB n=1 Tax=Gallaecimonas kandeliae TaxID=3029055 RepID=UPI002649993D|nr:flagellar motor protein MotB [Gallaecimonas kandeliae]WKE64904.1 flagellar motor protein MotB [Gallaecimonas kandeliae]
MSDAPKCKCPPPGLPPWMGTFADLMSLLMCFFVLLLSFSEMDVLKFKQIAGSMKNAFGVQNRVEVKDIPKGTSVIAQEFSPGRPEPTPIETVQQQTMEMTEQSLEFQKGESQYVGGESKQRDKRVGGESSTKGSKHSAENPQEQQDQMNELARNMAQALNAQIQDGAIELESLGQQIVIRIREKGSFPSGSAFLQPKFKPIIQQVGELLKDVPGEITVSGHTDDLKVHSELYSSNWDLSVQRALAVTHELLMVQGLDPKRLVVRGFADSQPLVPNDTEAHRRMNRRVEIAINQGKPKITDEIPAGRP